jgi:hypothetical protein
MIRECCLLRVVSCPKGTCIGDESGDPVSVILATAEHLRAASNAAHEAGEASNSEILDKVVLPILSVAEQGLGLALSRITLDDMVRRAVRSGHESKNGSVA